MGSQPNACINCAKAICDGAFCDIHDVIPNQPLSLNSWIFINILCFGNNEFSSNVM